MFMCCCLYLNNCSVRLCCHDCFFFFKQKTAYEISECDWSSDVCSSDPTLFRSDRKSTRLNSSHIQKSRMPPSACKKKIQILTLPNLLPLGFLADHGDPEGLAAESGLAGGEDDAAVEHLFVFFNDTATTEIYTLSYTLSLHDALPI